MTISCVLLTLYINLYFLEQASDLAILDFMYHAIISNLLVRHSYSEYL